jgi:hypothetical protein
MTNPLTAAWFPVRLLALAPAAQPGTGGYSPPRP